jgi:hypothetical protein
VKCALLRARRHPRAAPPTKEWVDKISDMHLFDQGWNKLRETIFANHKKLGVIPEDAALTAWTGDDLRDVPRSAIGAVGATVDGGQPIPGCPFSPKYRPTVHAPLAGAGSDCLGATVFAAGFRAVGVGRDRRRFPAVRQCSQGSGSWLWAACLKLTRERPQSDREPDIVRSALNVWTRGTGFLTSLHFVA